MKPPQEPNNALADIIKDSTPLPDATLFEAAVLLNDRDIPGVELAHLRIALLDDFLAFRDVEEASDFLIDVPLPQRAGHRDAVFGLEYLDRDASAKRTFFFLESDRSTMPLTRRDFAKTSFRRKLLAYEATWKQKLHQSHFSFHRFRVLTVTTSADRVTNLVAVCQKLRSARGLFLFTDMSSFCATDVLSVEWQSANGGSAVRLID